MRLLFIAADRGGRLRYLLITVPNIDKPDYTKISLFLIEPTGIDQQGRAGFENPQEFTGHLFRWRDDLKCWVELVHAAQPTADGMTCQFS